MLFGTTSIKNVSSVKNLEIFQILEKATICSVGENVKCVLVLCIFNSKQVLHIFPSFSVTKGKKEEKA